MTGRSALLLLLPMLATSACSSDTAVLGTFSLLDGFLQTDSAVYHVRTTEDWHEVTIGITYTNGSSVEVQIPACHTPHPPLLEKLGPNGWTIAYDPPVLRCITTPVSIGPGEEYAMTYRVIAGRRPNYLPRFEVDDGIPGTYRLNWTALRTKSGQLPSSHRMSAAFEIR